MNAVDFREDHVDILQEVFNVGMGRAGAALGKLLDTFVEMSIPRIEFVASKDALALMAERMQGASNVAGVRQAFHDRIRGETLILGEMEDPAGLARVLDMDSAEDDEFEEGLLEIANIISGACMSGLSEPLACNFAYSPPTILSTGGSVSGVFEGMDMPWECALMVEVGLTLSDFHLAYHVLIMMPDEYFSVLREALDSLLEECA